MPPVVEEVFKCLTEGDLGPPTGVLSDAGWVTHQDGVVTWPQTRFVDLNTDGYAGLCKQDFQNVGNSVSLS